jgi:glycosyltransferase involved in cell wall biosynthesis
MRELIRKGWDATVPPHDIVEHAEDDNWTLVDGKWTPPPPPKKEYSSCSTLFYLGAIDVDLWVLQRAHLIGFRGTRGNKTVIGDQDDSPHLPKWHRAYKNAVALHHKEMNDGYRYVDAMTVSTPQLVEDYADYCDNIYLLRNYLDGEMWADVPQQSEVERDRVRVGWMGAYDFHQGDVHVLRGVLGPWLEQNPQVDFVVAGPKAERTHDVLGISQAQRICVDGVAFGSGRLAEITATMDIGLVPLEPCRFNEAKSHLKGMEYAACGIPVIATPTESYRYWVREGVNGLFASKPAEWRTALEAFVGDDAFRRDCGRNARAHALEHTIDKHIHEWEEVYMAVCGGRALSGDAQRVGAPC